MKKAIAKLNTPGHANEVVARIIRQQWSEFRTSPFRKFVDGSVEVVVPDGGKDAWIDFKVDEERCGAWFRVTYSVFITRAGWGREIFCSAPSGLPCEAYGYTPGVLAAKVGN